MVIRKKSLFKSLFRFIKSCKFFNRKIGSTKRMIIAQEPNYDPPLYVYNKNGVIEFLSDQCEKNTCTCTDRCQVDIMIFYQSALLDDYKRKMREKQTEERRQS